MLSTERNLIDINLAKNPFETQPSYGFAEEGSTIGEILEMQQIDVDGPYTVVVGVGGEIVPREWYDKIRPKVGTVVAIRLVPRGGGDGKGIMAVLMGILIVVAAVFTGGAALSALSVMPLASITASTTIGALLPAVALGVGGLATIAGGIVSLTTKPPSVQVGHTGGIPTSKDSAALAGTRNSARLYEPVRMVLGQYRVFPDLIGKPFAERVGKDSVLRLLMCFGYGPLAIEDIKIGDIPIGDLIPSDKYQVLNGWDDDPPLRHFRDEVDSDSSFQPEFKRVNPDWDGVDPAMEGNTSFDNLFTGVGAEEISLDIVFPGGLICFNDLGAPRHVKVRFRIEHRQGSGSWSAIPAPTMGVDTSEKTDTGITVRDESAGEYQIQLAERGNVTRGIRWTVPSGSDRSLPHQIRLTRYETLHPATNKADRVVSDFTLATIRTIKPHVQTTVKNLARIELEINADDTGLSGVIDNLNALCTSILPKYDTVTKSWGPTHAAASALDYSMFKTRNAAWSFAHVLRGPANARPCEDLRIDGAAIAAWAGNLGTAGANPISGKAGLARNFDAVIDFTTTTREALSDIAGANRAALNMVDGKYSIVQDVPKTEVVQHFSPRNSKGFTGKKGFVRAPHAIRVHFTNPEKNYQKDERIVYADGYSETGNRSIALQFRGSKTATSMIEGGSDIIWDAAQSTLVGYLGYSVRQTITGSAPGMWVEGGSDNQLHIDTTVDSPPLFVRVKMRRVTKGDETWLGKMYYVAGTGSMTEAEYQLASEPDWSKGWVTVVWDMTTPAAGTWTGQDIGRLRFNFTSGGTSFGSVFEVEEVVVDDGTQMATEFSELSLWGVSDPDQVWRDARYYMASSQLRPELFSLESDLEHLLCNRGDLVRVSHDVIGVGLGGSRIKSLTLDGTNITEMQMEDEFYQDPTKDYSVRLRIEKTGTGPGEIMFHIVNQGTTSSTVDPEAATSWSGYSEPKVGDFLLYGERASDSMLCTVSRISPRNDLTAEIELVEYNENVYGALEDIPAYTSPISLPSPPSLLRPVPPNVIGSPVSDENAASYATSGSPTPQILINVEESKPTTLQGQYAATTHFHAQSRLKSATSGGVALTDWVNSPRIENTGDTRLFITPVEEGETYDIRVRSISDSSASASEWVYISDHVVVGLATPPDPPTDMELWGTMLRWAYGTKPADFAGFVVKYQSGSDSTWTTGTLVTPGITTDTWIELGSRVPAGWTTLMVRAVDLNGNESTTLSALKQVKRPGDLDNQHTVALEDAAFATVNTKSLDGLDGVWGVDTGEVDVNDHVVALVESTTYFWLNDNSTFWGVDSTVDFWGLTTYKTLYCNFYYVLSRDPEAAQGTANWPDVMDFPVRQSLKNISIEGSDYEIEYKGLKYFDLSLGHPTAFYTDWLPWPGERELLDWEYPYLLYWEYLYVRIKITGGVVQPKLKGISLVTDAPRKVKTSTVVVSSTGGTVVSLKSGADPDVAVSPYIEDRWRKITSVSVTPMVSGTSSQSGIYGEVYDIEAKHQPAGAGTYWELSGPTIKLWQPNPSGNGATETTGTVTVTLEGY